MSAAPWTPGAAGWEAINTQSPALLKRQAGRGAATAPQSRGAQALAGVRFPWLREWAARDSAGYSPKAVSRRALRSSDLSSVSGEMGAKVLISQELFSRVD